MQKKESIIRGNRFMVIAFVDIISILASYLLALVLRFDFRFGDVPPEFYDGYMWSMPYWIIVTVAVFYFCKMYHSVWRLASIPELKGIVEAYILLVPAYAAGVFFMHLHMPRSYYLMGYIINMVATVGIRFSYRFFRLMLNRSQKRGKEETRIMIIGAGRAGQTLIRELSISDRLHGKVCCIIDDNPTKKGRMLEGIPIVGNRHAIPKMVEKYEITQIIYAIPSTDMTNRKEILNICKDTGCMLRTVPGLYQLVNGEVSVSRLRNVEIEDLLGRDPVILPDEATKIIRDKIVFVTGGGGSIGSELCRQIADIGPKQLVIIDIYENSAYAIQQELKRKYNGNLNMEVRIASVRDTKKMDDLFAEFRPNVVFHAAAHKHVPLMEDAPEEAVKNNVFGTYNCALCAEKYGAEKFVLISTDKAVNPTNVMGATKRICEMIVQNIAASSDGSTTFVAVRFGNVLGSNGSVLPLFKDQLAEGGPLTVTHPDIVRYFMTIPEAVSLVLEAGAMGDKSGEIFVLDMGEPVKIVTLAENVIKMSGFIP